MVPPRVDKSFQPSQWTPSRQPPPPPRGMPRSQSLFHHIEALFNTAQICSNNEYQINSYFPSSNVKKPRVFSCCYCLFCFFFFALDTELSILLICSSIHPAGTGRRVCGLAVVLCGSRISVLLKDTLTASFPPWARRKTSVLTSGVKHS